MPNRCVALPAPRRSRLRAPRSRCGNPVKLWVHTPGGNTVGLCAIHAKQWSDASGTGHRVLLILWEIPYA